MVVMVVYHKNQRKSLLDVCDRNVSADLPEWNS